MAMSMAMASVVPALRCLSRNTETDRVANTTVPQSKSKNSSLPFLQKTWEYDPYSSSSSSSSSSDESSDSVLLQQWLTSQKLPPQKLSLQKVEAESGGRGLVATSNIRKGERLLFVPSSLIITTDSVCKSVFFGHTVCVGVMNGPLRHVVIKRSCWPCMQCCSLLIGL